MQNPKKPKQEKRNNNNNKKKNYIFVTHFFTHTLQHFCSQNKHNFPLFSIQRLIFLLAQSAGGIYTKK